MDRRVTSVEIRPLRTAAGAGISAAGTPASRLALVDILTAEAWALAGRASAPRPRAELPVRVRPLRATTPVAYDRASDG